MVMSWILYLLCISLFINISSTHSAVKYYENLGFFTKRKKPLRLALFAAIEVHDFLKPAYGLYKCI